MNDELRRNRAVEAVFEPGSQLSDLRKLRTVLPDWSPRDLETGLRATIPWYLENLRDATPAA